MPASGAFHHTLTFVAGFLVRPCCVIPAALAAAGAGGAGVAAAVTPYRPWLLAAAGLFFAASFYVNFVRNRSRPGMVVWGLSAMIAASLLLGPRLWAAPHPASSMEQERIDMSEDLTRTRIPVEAMACQACAERLQKALNRADGVVRAHVALAEKRAEVSHDPGRANEERLKAIIRDVGFQPGAPSDCQVE